MKKTLLYVGLLSLVFLLTGAGCISFGGGNKQTEQLGPAGMFMSVDKGENWKQISLLPSSTGVKNISTVDVYKIFTDPQDPAALYWATPDNGFFYSYDEGASWQQPEGDLKKGPIYSIAVDPENKCGIFVSNGGKILHSDDCNRSWTELYIESRPNVRIASIAINPTVSNQILAALNNGDIIQSLDSGKSWHTLHRLKIELVEIVPDMLQKDIFYLVTKKDGLMRSKDAGDNWVSLKDTMKDYSKANEFRRFVAHPKVPGRLYWISTFGILFSSDSGDSWNSINLITPPGSTHIFGFYVSPKKVDEIYYTATISNRSTFYKSVDGGQNWITSKLPSNQLPSVLYMHPEKDDVLYLGFTKIVQK
ncbi:MAG: hypothetical protein A2469_02240 [Candidatus Magasanikbacteria bacterium RIFOXYC2_FULL_40_16]|uniref:Sortilin N-terminal domain-containing protein n=3 Tax=Candidatus Magasanikiibacteriota TaxID=1752731 RepID=A0A1F6NJG5_9BACT|nr:MAG: hypothetical protein A2224_01280 [Candidatus Magasanikbacteria bacterium RIFOXYA2_FULL_40_20]OGH84022.1 MAG: hypothetical protein A2373_00490 [Candidatus Magasanikbacteria bacterium RIFOXYB1_FULL_40_15]OGH87942.1 MAG: hypothetical protein A2206_03560 [Candidatus Magasanikbacteria bacterium RIFOXYA1_FULL_40_8]OGH89226.1 MAG: hypothetical protein A2469_02240 [Candidatus Magasanikbacteria bacterium RIFOXYC2_FULL_40_16]